MIPAEGFHALSADAQAHYRGILAGLGVNLDEALEHQIDTSKTRRPVVITSDLQRTHILPKIVVLKDIATMNRLGGVPDDHFADGKLTDDHLQYPPAWDPRAD